MSKDKDKKKDKKLVDRRFTKKDLDIIKKTTIAISTSNTVTEASKRLGISRQGFYNRMEKYDLADLFEVSRREAIDTLKLSSIKATHNFVKKIDSRNESISMEASREVLNRAGVVPPTSTTNNVQVNVQPILQVNPTVEEVKDD